MQYCVVTAALNQLTKNLCCEWAKDGILVNSVAPWYTVTPLVEQYLQDKPTMDQIIARTPLERVAYPPEVSGKWIIQLPYSRVFWVRYSC